MSRFVRRVAVVDAMILIKMLDREEVRDEAFVDFFLVSFDLVLIPKAVKGEVRCGRRHNTRYKLGRLLKKWERVIRLCPVPVRYLDNLAVLHSLMRLGRGEREGIAQILALMAGYKEIYLISDDGDAINECKKLGLKYLNYEQFRRRDIL